MLVYGNGKEQAVRCMALHHAAQVRRPPESIPDIANACMQQAVSPQLDLALNKYNWLYLLKTQTYSHL